MKGDGNMTGFSILQGIITAFITLVIFIVKEWIQKSNIRRDLAKEQLDKVYSKIHIISLETYIYFINKDTKAGDSEKEYNLDFEDQWEETFNRIREIVSANIYLLTRKDLGSWRRMVVRKNQAKTPKQIAEVYRDSLLSLTKQFNKTFDILCGVYKGDKTSILSKKIDRIKNYFFRKKMEREYFKEEKNSSKAKISQ